MFRHAFACMVHGPDCVGVVGIYPLHAADTNDSKTNRPMHHAIEAMPEHCDCVRVRMWDMEVLARALHGITCQLEGGHVIT